MLLGVFLQCLFQLRDKREERKVVKSANADGFKSGLAASREATAMRFARYAANGGTVQFQHIGK